MNSARETLLSGSAAATAAAAASAAVMMAKSPQRDDAAPKELQDRRKSMSWKTFNLKRQLSKVNMKIGGLNVNTDMESLKNSSIFYTPKEVSPEAATPPATEEEATPEGKEDESLDDGEMATNAGAAAAASPSPAVRGKFRSSTTDSPDEGASSSIASGIRRVDFEQPAGVEVERPNNLPLADAPAPLKPARQKFKEKSRDQRLLSVPNIKYQPRDSRGGARNLKNDVSPLMGGGGGGGGGGVVGASSGIGGSVAGGKKIRKYGPSERITIHLIQNNKSKERFKPKV